MGQGRKKEGVNTRVAVSETGGDMRGVQRVSKSNKICSKEDEELGIATRESQSPEKYEDPRTERDYKSHNTQRRGR